MSAPDPRVMMACCSCGYPFLALGKWQTRCRSCYARHKAAQAGPDMAALLDENARLRAEVNRLRAEVMRAKGQAIERPVIPREQWRRLLQLVHPDRHGGSPAATEATRSLLEARP